MTTFSRRKDMGQPIIDCWSAREVRTDLSPTAKCCCSNCGADFWHIRQNGEVFCADCDEPSNVHFLKTTDR